MSVSTALSTSNDVKIVEFDFARYEPQRMRARACSSASRASVLQANVSSD